MKKKDITTEIDNEKLIDAAYRYCLEHNMSAEEFVELAIGEKIAGQLAMQIDAAARNFESKGDGVATEYLQVMADDLRGCDATYSGLKDLAEHWDAEAADIASGASAAFLLRRYAATVRESLGMAA